ncbi:hypothetical protein GQ457_08G017470 [Hibiscus cannabinus]
MASNGEFVKALKFNVNIVNQHYTMVFDLLNTNCITWNKAIIQSIFFPNQPRKFYVCNVHENNFIIWVRFALHKKSPNVYGSLWPLNISAKVKISCWKFLNNYLLTSLEGLVMVASLYPQFPYANPTIA